ncbi:MAG: hypothetical protein GPOALKHO_001066 [Sodalis sp.]|uniref:hypothetical protein n=1 Tax=Sodalis sp. (in: enterobacteria) TaxID=1898979 RepID=UPI003873A16C|nr:MAG: hypothetical protein GPOALKHO_001066 [Sodalis sp.]
MTMLQGRLKILLLDNGKELGGGSNSPLELLKRIDRFEVSFTIIITVTTKKPSATS